MTQVFKLHQKGYKTMVISVHVHIKLCPFFGTGTPSQETYIYIYIYRVWTTGFPPEKKK